MDGKPLVLSFGSYHNHREEGKEGEEEKKIYAEVWGPSSLLKTFQLDQCHGKIMGDSWFGAFSWSEDEV